MNEIIEILKLLLSNPSSFTFLLTIFLVPWLSVFYLAIKIYQVNAGLYRLAGDLKDIQGNIQIVLQALLKKIELS